MFNRKNDKLTWKVDWHFPLSDVTYSDKSVDDTTVIADVLNKYLATEASDVIRCVSAVLVSQFSLQFKVLEQLLRGEV